MSRVRAIGLGAFVGLTWAMALRAWMTHLAIQFDTWPESTWEGTFLAVMAPGAIVGALIGWDWHSRVDGEHGSRWVAWSPLLLVVGPALLADDFVGTLMDTGEGGGAIGVVLVGMAGGLTISGRGPRWLRSTAGLIAVGITGAMVYFLYLTDPLVTSNEAFGTLFLVTLLIWLAIGCSLPMRYQGRSAVFRRAFSSETDEEDTPDRQVGVFASTLQPTGASVWLRADP